MRRAWLWVIPILLLAAWLGARGLTADAIWYDEYWSIYYAGGTHDGPLTPLETWNRVAELNRSSHELNPPGYYVALNLWSSAVGWSDAGVRSLSLAVGLLAIASVYRLGRALASPFVAVIAAAAIGVSAFYLNYLHEARAYALFPLFVAATTWAYWRIVTGRGGRRTQAFFLLSMVAVFYTHYLASLAVVAIAFYHLLFVPKTRDWWRVPILMALAAMLFLPWLRETLGAVDNVATTEGREAYNMSLPETFQLLGYGFGNGLYVIPMLVAVGALLSKGRAARFVGFLTVVVLVIGLVGNEFLPFLGHIRYLMALVPPWALLFAFTVDWLRRHQRTALAVALVVSWLAAGVVNAAGHRFDDALFRSVYLDIFRPHVPLDQARDRIAAQAQDGDAVAYYAPAYPWALAGTFDYYFYPLGLHHAVLNQFPGQEANSEYAFQVLEFIEDAPRVWLVAEPGEPDFHLTEFTRVLEETGFARCPMIAPLSGLSLELYAREPACCCPPDDPVAESVAVFDNQVALTYVSPLPQAVSAVLRVRLAWWQAETVPLETYSVALHVLDSAGNLVAQSDDGLPDRRFQCQAATIGVSHLPPGDYTLAVILYSWHSGMRVPGRLTATGEGGDTLPIGTFAVR